MSQVSGSVLQSILERGPRNLLLEPWNSGLGTWNLGLGIWDFKI